MKSRADVLQSIQAKIHLLHLAYSTEEAYCGWVGRYYDFCLNLPKAWPPERKAEAFLTDLAVNVGVAARTQNQALAALLFLYGDVMRKPLGNICALRAKKPAHGRSAQRSRLLPPSRSARHLRLASRPWPWRRG